MDPQKLVNEYLAAVGAGIRFIITLIISAMIAGKITKLFETDNFFAYALVLFGVTIAIYATIDFCLRKRKSKEVKPTQRGGYD